MLELRYTKDKVECGCDEAGRGCLAGPVYAAAVILPKGYKNEKLNDSKQLTEKERYALRSEIERDAVSWAVAWVDNEGIDKSNILKASFHAMNLAIAKLKQKPEMLLIDGNRFYDESGIPYECFVKGDGRYMPIAAASILAKTYRDDYMTELSKQYPGYGWEQNKGYPTKKHYEAIEKLGITEYHRKTYKLERQLELTF